MKHVLDEKLQGKITSEKGVIGVNTALKMVEHGIDPDSRGDLYKKAWVIFENSIREKDGNIKDGNIRTEIAKDFGLLMGLNINSPRLAKDFRHEIEKVSNETFEKKEGVFFKLGYSAPKEILDSAGFVTGDNALLDDITKKDDKDIFANNSQSGLQKDIIDKLNNNGVTHETKNIITNDLNNIIKEQLGVSGSRVRDSAYAPNLTHAELAMMALVSKYESLEKDLNIDITKPINDKSDLDVFEKPFISRMEDITNRAKNTNAQDYMSNVRSSIELVNPKDQQVKIRQTHNSEFKLEKDSLGSRIKSLRSGGDVSAWDLDNVAKGSVNYILERSLSGLPHIGKDDFGDVRRSVVTVEWGTLLKKLEQDEKRNELNSAFGVFTFLGRKIGNTLTSMLYSEQAVELKNEAREKNLIGKYFLNYEVNTRVNKNEGNVDGSHGKGRNFYNIMKKRKIDAIWKVAKHAELVKEIGMHDAIEMKKNEIRNTFT